MQSQRAMNMKSLRTDRAENHIIFSISADREERSMLCASFHITTHCFFNKKTVHSKHLVSDVVSVNCPGYMNVNKSLWAPR